MIICRDCGHQNEDDDQFCGSCGSFLEFSGERQVVETPATESSEDDGDSWKERAKRALDVADENVAHHDATQQSMRDEDAELAAAVVAKQAAEEAERIERQRAEEAARRIEESNAQRAKAEADAKQAERELEELRARQQAEAEAAQREAEAEQQRVAEERAAKIAEAEAQAKADAERERLALERKLQEEQEAAEHARVVAAQEAERAQQAEARAEQQRAAIEEQLQEAAAAAAAATLRASQERDAIAAADAAREASELEAQRSRIAAEAAAAEAAQEVARMRSEAEAAKSESAALRAQLSADAAKSELERQRLRAEVEAAEQATAARRRVEAEEAANQQRRDAQAHASLVKAQAEHDAAQRKAEAELEAKRAEAEAAKARAEEERARAAADAEAAKREREEALRKAASLVAPKASVATPVTPGSAKAPTASGAQTQTSGKVDKSKVSKSSKSSGDATPEDTTNSPGARLPGAAAPKVAPRKVRDAELNPGELVCGQCGSGNVPTRKFCRRCGNSLVEAKKAKLGLFARMRSRKRRKKQRLAGDRKGMKGAATGARNSTRRAWYGLARTLSRVTAVLAVFALLGFGVEPIRQKLQLPNLRQKAFDTFRRNVKPIYDPIRPSGVTASSAISKTAASALIDLGNNTSWQSKPSANSGVGSRITVTFEKPVDLGRVLFTSGLAESTVRGKGFVSQPRPSELRVTFDDDLAAPQVVRVADKAEPQVLNITHKEMRKVTFEISAVYPAADGKGKSVAITEIEFFERRKIGDSFEKLAKPQLSSIVRNGLVSLTDEDLATSWTSAPTDDGVGQGFSITFATPTDLDRIRIAPGGAEATFQVTPRPHDVQLAFTCQGQCDATKQVSFDDEPGFKTIGVKAKGVTRIDVIVRSVYGTGGGVTFSELEFYRKRPTVGT